MIYKYDLGKPNNHGDYPTAIITHGEIIKKFLDIQLQDGNAVIWAEVEKANVGNNYIIVKAIWTGFEEPANMIYLGTLQEPQYGTVYHYYAEDPRGKEYK